MQNSLSQLTLGIGLKDEARFDNFYAGKNQEIISELKKAASGTGERMIYLCGAPGLGYSHLLQAACHHAHQYHLSSLYLPLANLMSFSAEILTDLDSLSLVCVDDLHMIAGRPEWEEGLFYLYNRMNERGGRLIVATHNLPRAINITLPDLVSRLSWGIVYQLHALTDEEKLNMLTMRARLRGIHLSEEVSKYILTHCKRHIDHLFATLDTLDKASLTLKRRLTIPLVKEVLQI